MGCLLLELRVDMWRLGTLGQSRDKEFWTVLCIAQILSTGKYPASGKLVLNIDTEADTINSFLFFHLYCHNLTDAISLFGNPSFKKKKQCYFLNSFNV